VTMACVPELLLGILEELVDKELRKFQWFLTNVSEGYTHIPKSRVDGVDRTGTVDLLVQTYGYDGAVTVTEDILLKMNLKLWAEKLKEGYTWSHNSSLFSFLFFFLSVSCNHADKEKLKSTLKEKYQNIYEGNADEGETVYLKKIYTELHMIEGAWGSFSEEHEVRQQRSAHVSVDEKSIKENTDIAFLFPLPFRELNTIIGEKDYSLMQLIHQFFPAIKPLEKLGTDCKVLFIFDGLDETLLPLNFKENKVLRDETEPALLDVLITNLITGDLLGNALIWITSRPAAANRIPRKYIDQWTEVKGFGNDQREEYFKRSLHNDSLALKVINHVKSSRSLYIMCQIPVFCWITVTVMKKLVLRSTLQTRQGSYGEAVGLWQLGELAFRQLEKGKLIFYEADLKECGMDVTEATIYSGVCTEIFMMEGERRRKVFSFVHLTIQEFLAAVHAHYSYMQRKENVFLGYLKRIFTRWLSKSVFNFHKTAIEKALESPDGRWDLVLRFLLGLSLKSNQELLCKILDLDAEGEEDVVRTIQFIKEKINEEAEAKLNLFHCLSELKEEALVQKVQSFVSSGRLNAKKMSPAQWSALTFDLMTSETTKEELNCCNLTENCCKSLASALSSTSSHLTVLDLSENKLRDSGVKLLSAGLNSPHCKLKSLRLKKCQLQGDCCEALAVAVSTEFTQLRDLDLSANDFQSTHLKALCVGMCSHHCKLETLRLNRCKLREDCCADLASVLNSGSSLLKTLDLSNNSLKDSGVSLLAAGLRNPVWCSLTQKCCDPIGWGLTSDSKHLTELDLSGNNLHGPDFQLLCSGLRSQHCKLKTLRLDECSLQKCCGDVASVLSSDSSHLKELDLSGNDLQDLEVKLLSDGLSNPSCTLETLK
uniref:Pyrin domain-containing protein n=1 Tax=Amphilophus citrinellus TaxID=61819 RepID=A0A3Q0RVT6_AMPCI